MGIYKHGVTPSSRKAEAATVDGYSTNRVLGRYMIYSKEANVAPFHVKALRDELPISTHWTATDAVQAIMRYRAIDESRG